jgi:hypothetical protein
MKRINTMEAKTYKVQSQVFDIDAFEKVTLVKEFTLEPVGDVQEALSRLGGDTGKLTQVINEGLVSLMRDQVKNDADGWKIENEKGELEDFGGTAVDDSAVNAMVLSMAKGSFGYFDAKNAEEKKASKAQAIAVIKSTPVLLNGLKAQVAKSK